jgi:TonB family protein
VADAAGPVAALTGGRPGAIPPEYEAYVRALRRRIEERLAYPALAVRRGVQGTVELELQLDPGGRLTAVVEVGRDGGLLREAAIRAVRSATPFPFPPGLAARALTIRLPIVFELQQR